MREMDTEVSQILSVSTIPFKDNKCVMEAHVDNGSVLVDFKPVSNISNTQRVSINKNCGWSWKHIMDHVAEKLSDEFRRHVQVYDLICVFRNISFEAAADLMEQQ